MIIYMLKEVITKVDRLKSRNTYGDNVFASRNHNILDTRKHKKYRPIKRLSDIPTNNDLGLIGQIAKNIAPNYVDELVANELGPFAGVVKSQIAYNKKYEESKNDWVKNKKNTYNNMYDNAEKHFNKNEQHYQNTLDIIRKQQEEYGGKTSRKTIRKTRRKTRRKTIRKTRRKTRRKIRN